MAGSAENGPGLFAWFGVPIPFPERVRLIRAAGFSSTSIWWEEARPEGRRLRHLAPGIAREAGLAVDHIHVPYRGCNDLWSGVKHRREEAVARHAGWVEDCARHGVGVMVMHAVSGRGVGVSEEHGLDSVACIVDRAAALGVTVAVENTRRNDLVELLLGRFPSPHLGLCYDNAHDALHHEDAPALLRRQGHRLVTTHLSDCDGKRDQHWVPGEGTLDFEELGGALSGLGGTRLLEVVQRDTAEDTEAFLARAYAAAVGLAGAGV